MNKKVSIIIPTYKRSEFLERAIESVLNQTYKNIEVIIVDDNEPNSEYRTLTGKTMLQYGKDNKVRYIKNKKNLGGALARNEGIFNSTGDYITFLDDDDIYLPNKVETQINYMIEKNVDLTFTDVRFHNTNNILVDYRQHDYIESFENKELLRQHIMHHLTPTGTYMFKREPLINIGGFDDVKMGQEFMLMLKAIENGLNIEYIKEANIIQFLHEGERISVGQNKINKEVELFDFKKQYFSELSDKEIRYVKFRHHAVMMVAGKRSRKYSLTIKHLFNAMTTSPLDCILEMKNHRRKIKTFKNAY